MTIKAILFDMDGVLIDAKEWHYESLNKSLSFFNFATISREDHEGKLDGLPTLKKLEFLYNAYGSPTPSDYNKVEQLKQQYTMEIAKQSCNPIPLQQETLSNLKSERYKMACCSNSIKESVDLFLNLADIHKYFEFFLSNQDVSKAKPDPEIYLLAMKKLNVLPSEVVICEDNFNGICAAKASGAHVLEIKTTKDVNYNNISNFIKEVNGKS